mmetsp:Transcript_45669/g.40906  ORF Transcript_45669/g.40906 Transcript_45669/m.40906 type:complete len:408 (-) Transcript_45669:7-1230(-)
MMATESSQSNGANNNDSIEIPKYHWDWNEKLGASPFRKEIKRLKQDNKNNPSNKSSNNEFKRILRAKEKDLLGEFGKKCDQARIWINVAKQDTADENHDNPVLLKQIEYQRKKEKIETIDKFWEELLCVETVFLQNEKIRRQNEQIANMEKQLADAQKKLDLLNGSKNKSNVQSQPQKQQKPTVSNGSNTVKKKKKKKSKKDKQEYMGLVGYFNKPRKENKKKKKEKKKEEDHTLKDHGFMSYSYVPKVEGDGEEYKNYEKRVPDKKEEIVSSNNSSNNSSKVETESKPKQQKKSKGTKSSKGSMKGGFFNAGSKGLYDDKKAPDDYTVDELNAKNEKQINEMGLKDTTNNPFFSWERPKMEERMKAKQEGREIYGKKGDAAGLTQFLDAHAKAADNDINDDNPQQK